MRKEDKCRVLCKINIFILIKILYIYLQYQLFKLPIFIPGAKLIAGSI